MITRSGVNGYGEHHWTLHVPEERCVVGLEVGVIATAKGLVVGDGVISWDELDVGRQMACTHSDKSKSVTISRKVKP
jgi:hypothetical protein